MIKIIRQGNSSTGKKYSWINSTQLKLKIFLLKIHKNIYRYINKAETQLGLFASVQIGSLTRNNTTFTTDKEG